jgi:cell division protein FtsI/penicillin-binding protein 2/outer membrane protein assembly factor BamB
VGSTDDLLADSDRTQRKGSLMAVSRRALVISGLGTVTAVVLGVVAVLNFRSDPEPTGPDATPSTSTVAVAPDPGDPAPVAQAFLVAWAREDWSALNSLVTDLSAGQNHADWWRGLEASNVELNLTSVDLLGEGRAFALFDVSLDVSTVGEWGYSSQLTLIWDGATWLIDWFPDVLHPLLTSGDHLELVRTWPERAPILGQDGVVLATTLPTVRAGVIPNRVDSRAEVRQAFETYTDVDAERVDEVMDAPNVQPDWFLPITVIPREEYPDVRPALYPIPGIAFRVTEGRAPVEPGLALHVLGTTGEISADLLNELGEPYRIGDLVGRTPSSLERTHERALAGSPRVDIVKLSGSGAMEVLESFPGVPAVALETTLSLGVQRAAEAALEGIETPAALVAIDVATGEIRAVVSRPLEGFNRAVTGLYPPGSTFKLVVTLAALESGFTRDSQLECPEQVTVGGQEFGNAVRLPDSLSLEQAVVRSCNTAFIGLAGNLDPAAIDRAARQLGFNLDYTIGLATPGGSYPAPAGQTEAAAAAIGQARVLATPVHMASVAAGLAAGGWRPPTLIERDLVDVVDPIDPEIAATIQDLMIRVVEDRNGTGSNARVEGRTVGGKTGTAQLGSGEDDPLVAWFVGFSDDIAFAVMVEDGESGGRTAAPIAAAFLEFLEQVPGSQETTGCTDPADGWPTFQGNNARTGCATGVEAIGTAVVKWSADVGIQAWLNSPVIVDDLVIVGTAGSSRGRVDSLDGVVAVRLSDGAIEWRTGAARDVNGVAAAGGTVIVTGDEGKVVALRASNGRVRWEFDAKTLVFTNPLIVGDLVIVGDAAGVLWALDIEDGTMVWQEFLPSAIRGGAASDGRLIYAAAESGEVVAVNLDGEKIWERAIDVSADSVGRIRILATPTVVGESVVFAVIEDGTFTGPALVAFDKYVGTERWRAVDSIGAGWSSVSNSPSIHRGKVVFASSLSSGIQAVDAASGAGAWAAETAVLCDRQWASTLVIGDTVVVPRTDGSLYAFDAVSGTTVWELPLTAGEVQTDFAECTRGDSEILSMQLQATPAVAPDGTIIVGSVGGWLYAVTAEAQPQQ